MSRAQEASRIPPILRVFLLGCIAITFGYLLLHAREPLRLNLGDPAADARVLASISSSSSERSLVTVVYGAIGKLGISEVGTLRLFALVFSALAILLLFQYARRIWTDTVALIATALFTTSLAWMMYADSIHQAPITQAAGLLGLWGLVRAIETRQRRHHAAAFFGACACFLTSPDYWLFLPAAVLFTVHVKLGNPFARGNRRLVALCLSGCIAGLLVKALLTSGAGHELTSPLSTLLRRYTLGFSPLFWVTFAHTTWRGVRAPSLTAVLEDGVTWMLVVAVLFVGVFSQRAGAGMLGAQVLLPFYAIGSAILIARLLEHGRLRRWLAFAWLGSAPVWSFWVMFHHPRSVLDRDDVARVSAYLAANDHNDFVMSNLISDGPLEAAFQRHSWAALDAADTTDARLKMLDMFETTGTDYIDAVIFTTPDSRFVDRSLSQLAVRRRLSSVTGWPHLRRSKAYGIIREYDKNVLANLVAVNAKKVLELSNFDVYRIDRASVLEAAGKSIRVVREIDFGGLAAKKHTLLGWGEPWLLPTSAIAVTSIEGYTPCPHGGLPGGNVCKTMSTDTGLQAIEEGAADRAQLLIRVERACDLRLTIGFGSPALLSMSINGFTALQCAPGTQVSFLVPQSSVRAGLNVITFEKRFGPMDSRADFASLTIDPVCGPN